MKHFVAYHSERVMGHEYPAQASGFYSARPKTFLQKSLGSRIWVINGAPSGRKTSYSLRAYFTPEEIVELEEGEMGYDLNGQTIVLPEPVALDGFDWFHTLRRQTSNFSIGIAEIKDEAIIQALMTFDPALETGPDAAVESDIEDDWLNVEISAVEGREQRMTHLRRERNRALVEAKKKVVQTTTGRLACEVCGFDFRETYGTVGEGLCEVHHKTPLAQLGDHTVTKLEDLGILCSNCHRVIHRIDPMVTIEELRMSLKNLTIG